MPNLLDFGGRVQVGLFERLTGDATLMGMVTGIFDQVPEGQEFPYVSIRERQGVNDGTHDSDGAQIIVDVRTWTKAMGNKQGDEIGERIKALINRQASSLNDVGIWMIKWEFGQSLGAGTPDTRQRLDRYRVWISEGSQ